MWQEAPKALEPKDGAIGPNSRYFGKKKDMTLLFQDYTPELADTGSVKRRAMMAAMVKPAMRKARDLGLLGLAGAMLVKGLTDKKDEST
jgi:hypothetical protein